MRVTRTLHLRVAVNSTYRLVRPRERPLETAKVVHVYIAVCIEVVECRTERRGGRARPIHAVIEAAVVVEVKVTVGIDVSDWSAIRIQDGARERAVTLVCFIEKSVVIDTDIDTGASLDLNADGTPDECQVPGDFDGDGLTDDIDPDGMGSTWQGGCPVGGHGPRNRFTTNLAQRSKTGKTAVCGPSHRLEPSRRGIVELTYGNRPIGT